MFNKQNFQKNARHHSGEFYFAKNFVTTINTLFMTVKMTNLQNIMTVS